MPALAIWTKDPQEFLNNNRDITAPGPPDNDPANPAVPNYVTDADPPNIPDTSDLGIGVLRYGIPAVAAAVGLGPLALGAIGTGMELSAQQAEQGLHIPTVEDQLSAAFSGLAEYAGGKWLQPTFDVLGNKVMNVGARVLNKVLVPYDFYKSTGSSSTQALYKMLKGLGSSPTPGQVMDNDFTQFIEGIARGALFGKGPVKKLDKENAKLLTGQAKDYIEAHARLGWESTPFDDNGALKQLSKERFGQLANAVLDGKFNMMEKIMGRNYEAVRELVKDSPQKINTQGVMDTFKEFEDNPAMQKIYNSIKPWLATKGDDLSVLNETNPIKAMEALKYLNKFLGGRVPDDEKWAAGQLKASLAPELRKSLETIPQALEAYDYAQGTAKKFFTNLDNEVVGKLKETFDTYPSTVIQTINGSTAKKFDVLKSIKTAYQTTSEGEATGSLKAYQRNVIEPLRYSAFEGAFDAQGRLLGNKLESNLGKMGPDYGKEVFGGEEGLNSMFALARAAKNQLATTENVGNRTMYIKMAQGSAIAGAGMGAYGWSQDNTAAKVTTVGLFLTPVLLSRYVVGNPALTQAVIDGMTSSVGSKTFNRAAAQMVALSMKDSLMSSGQAEIYNNPPGAGVVSRETKVEGVDQSLQFIPMDTQTNATIQQPPTLSAAPPTP